jgi:hypothetical protein
MPYMHLVPLVLQSGDVPLIVAGPIAAAGAAAIAALYKRNTVLTDRGREDTREIIPAVKEAAAAMESMAGVNRQLVEKVDELTRNAVKAVSADGSNARSAGSG